MQDLLVLPLAASALSAIACGSVGTLTLVRRNTYVAGAVSHSVLAGLGLAQFLATVHGLHWFSPTLGALLAAVAAALFIVAVQFNKIAGNDAALSTLWAVGMAIGIAFMNATPGYQADLMNYLFGSILLVSSADLWLMAILDGVIILALALFWRGILAVSFNTSLAGLRGVRTRLYETILSLMTALAIVLLVRVVGIVLVIALLTLPAIAAKNVARRLVPMMMIATLAAFAAMASGIAISWYTDFQPSAPIVLTATGFAMLAYGIGRIRLYFARKKAHSR